MTSIDDISHVDGVPWYEAKMPPRLHFCKAQSTAWMDLFTLVERCACGALRRDGRYWMDKNQRRKK